MIPSIKRSIDESGTLVLEWDNRLLARNKFLTILFPVLWISMVVITYAIYRHFLDWSNSQTIIAIFFTFVVLGVATYGSIVTWLGRRSIERVVISDTEYQHIYVRYPRLYCKKWRLADITAVGIGHLVGRRKRESIVTLSVFNGWRRDIIGYWISNVLKREIFEIIKNHLKAKGCKFEIIDNVRE